MKRVKLSEFFLRGEGRGGEEHRERLANSRQIRQIEERIASSAGGAKPPALLGRMEAYLRELLDIPLEEILTEGWKRYGAIRDACERSKSDPEKTLFLSLAKHTLLSEHHPRIEIELSGKKIGEIAFDIRLRLTLEGFVLRIRGGEIVAIDTGTCLAEGSVACGDVVLIEKGPEKVVLPGTIVLESEGANDGE